MWRVELTDAAKKQLEKLDKPIRQQIESWLKKNVDECENPRAHGRALVGDKAGKWRYRIGSYRVICEIEDDKLVVLAVRVAHRREAYKK